MKEKLLKMWGYVLSVVLHDVTWEFGHIAKKIIFAANVVSGQSIGGLGSHVMWCDVMWKIWQVWLKYLGGRSDENIWEGGQLIVEVGDLARGVQRRDLLPISAATALVLFLCTRLLGPKYLANGHVILDQLQKRDLLPIFAGTALMLLFLLGPKYLAN